MKLVVAVVQAEDASGVTSQLASLGFRSTRIKTVGGFLREANATLLVGVEDEDVDVVLFTIGEACESRRERIAQSPAVAVRLPWMQPVEVGGATVLVLNVVRFERV